MATLTSFAEKSLKDKIICFWRSANDDKKHLFLSDIGIEKKIQVIVHSKWLKLKLALMSQQIVVICIFVRNWIFYYLSPNLNIWLSNLALMHYIKFPKLLKSWGKER